MHFANKYYHPSRRGEYSEEGLCRMKFGYYLHEEVSSHTSKEENKRLYHVAWQMQHLLNSKEAEIRGACKNNPKALEHFSKHKSLDEIL